MKNTWNNPIFSLVLLPFATVIVGTRLGSQLNSFQIYRFFLLYVFLLLTHLNKKLWSKKRETISTTHLSFQRVVNVLIAVTLFLFSIAVNVPATFLLFLYLFYSYVIAKRILGIEGTFSFIVLELFFQVFIMNVVAFYLQTNYFSVELLPYLMPVSLFTMLVILLMQRYYVHRSQNGNPYQMFIKKNSLHLMVGVYIVAILSTVLFLRFKTIPFFHQMIFLLSQPIVLFPIAFRSFRLQVRTDRYLSTVVSITIIVFASVML